MTSPTFAVVSAVYGVARYLPEFFASLEAQTYAHEKLKVILIDDGSVDGSGDLCERWADATTLQVEVIRLFASEGVGAGRGVGASVPG